MGIGREVKSTVRELEFQQKGRINTEARRHGENRREEVYPRRAANVHYVRVSPT